jgi:2-dehydro-3-deoxyphosphooctonate aldolase (KDO 8-P synthase)
MSESVDAIVNQRDKLTLIAGPCLVESENIVMRTAEIIKDLCTKNDINPIFKASYRKANRTELTSFVGIGDEKSLKILDKVRSTFGLLVTTDIHSVSDVVLASSYVDIIQIPALLSKQTDILIAAAKTGKIINIKKGQFMSCETILSAIEKVRFTGNEKILITERGNSFGYDDVVIDFRGIPIMQSYNVQVFVDCTHTIKRHAEISTLIDSRYKMIETIAKAAIAVGANGIFLETHPDLSTAKCDASTMLDLKDLDKLLTRITQLHKNLDYE